MITNPIAASSIDLLITNFIDLLRTISFPLGIVIVIVAAYLFVTSAGNEEQLKTAKRTILYLFIGFLFIILAKAIAEIILSWFK